ncbi:intermembrane lipid transfer protein VPS13C isoform X2 [Paramormyrops kingsleyae]|uniref:intermembrane lipid transfer protein VPS13C isoform X2 n=1 Tax=Paramormyrops kingsleyae TaxID=1676925 RepID=UPI003B96ECE0
MVFEALVSDLLNRFIGDYVENLDKSQLKIGIWGGNVVLENLRVKENALSELDVPFKVKAGQVGKLTLKIPWKNLYSEAVVATLDGLYLLVVPGATIKYDAAKEEKYMQEAKQKELQRIEEALQLAACRGRKLKMHKKTFKKSKRHERKQEKPQEEKKDTFTEKLATQVIKNLQVKITSIHIRYEDDVSDPERPLSMGITLAELSLQTTDENWKICILNEAAKIIYKLGRLDCLCAYWNTNSQIFYRGSWEEIVGKLQAGISTKDRELKDYQCIFKPIFASAKICINPNAEVELKSPKVKLYLEVQNIAIEMTKPQYLSMIDLLESVDYMVKNGPYRKYRPDVPVEKNANLWWRYAIGSVLEVHIRRFNRMWSWSQIIRHRQNLKAYKAAYKVKLTQGKLKEDTEKQIQDLEKVLDVFNITLVRQQAQMEMIRSGQKVLGKKAVGQKQGGGGFFGSFFGRKEGKKKEQEESKELESIDDLMTPEEKAKLYTAIGYSGSSHNLALPKEYVAIIVSFKLNRTSVTLREESGVPEILKVQMIDLSTMISQRPGAQAMKVEASLQHWYVTGLQQQGVVPSLITSVGDAASSLLSIQFELNPEASGADQLLRVHSQPVEIIYDAMTVNSMADFFKTGKGLDLEVITSATLMKLEEIKEKTATGLSHIIETRKILDLRIDLKPSYLLVPKSGFYDGKSDLMILDFGSLKLNSVDQGANQQVSASFSSLEEIMDRAYERYALELRSVQILYSKSGESWKAARTHGSSSQHILQPMDFTVQLAKSMVDRDARMPRFKLSGELPLLHVKISDHKIHGVLDLVNSIPLPQMASTPTTPTKKRLPVPLADSRAGILSLGPSGLLDAMETDSEEDASETALGDESQVPPAEELTDLQFRFEVKAVLVELTRQAEQESTILALNVSQLGTEGKMRTYDITVTSYLCKISLDYCEERGPQNQPLHLISSSDTHGSPLLKVEYIKADTNGPNFQSMFDNTEQTLKVEFSSLDFLMHTRALLSTMSYFSTALPKQVTDPREATKLLDKDAPGKLVFRGSKEKHVFNFKLFAVLGAFRVVVCDDWHSIADIIVQGIDASVLVQAKETEVFARLRNIVVTDVDPKTIHKKAVSIVGGEVFSFKMLLYPNATEGDGYADTSKVDGKVTLKLGCIQIVYLHKFLVSLLKFIDNFQTAKEALTAATAQAAEKAASSVRDLAQKSFRLSMNIWLKAPVIVVPQSPTSHNAFVIDLGLITVANSFSLMEAEGFSLPAVVEKMDVKLTQLKLSRTTLKNDSPHSDIELLQPVNLELIIKRNLAASWFTKIPGVEVQGVLKSMNMELGQEDFGVLMKILVENIGEGSKEQAVDMTRASDRGVKGKTEDGEQPRSATASAVEMGSKPPVTHGEGCENTINVLVNFEIKEVVLKLKKVQGQTELPFLVLYVDHFGTDARMRQYDMSAVTYIKKITLKCLEFSDSCGDPLSLVSSSVESGGELLKVQYLKADKNGPHFATVHMNTEQKIDVIFTSLDLMLHTEALLSTINFLSAALSFSSMPSPEREQKLKMEDSKALVAKPTPAPTLSDGDVVDLQIAMQLGAFNVLVCDEKGSIADIKIQGCHGSLLMQGTQTRISTRLRDFIVINVDPKTIHKKAISIVGDEVFSFSLSLTPKATEGGGYTDTSKVDGKVKLNVGCIQVVYLHKFIMSLVNFTNNFQMAKEALTAATAQAAEKAASSVRDLAQKSFRLSMDIRLKAPVIVVPQSSTSHDAVEVDLGLITVGNSFSLLPVEGCPLPAVIDEMRVQLSQLKLCRIYPQTEGAKPNTELLEPVNFLLSVRRNLAASWFQKMAAVEVDGDLKPMKVALSQEDLSVLLKILMDNLGEAGSVPTDGHVSEGVVLKQESLRRPESPKGDISTETNPADQQQDPLVAVKFNFNVEALTLLLFRNDPTQVAPISQHQESLCLGELTLHLMKASGKMFSSGALEVSTILTTCTLDDRRTGIQRVTSRMVGKQAESSGDKMIDVTYSERDGERSVVAVLQKLYVCASVEFLMAVADFFIQAMPQSPAAVPDRGGQLPLRQISEPKSSAEPKASSGPKMTVQAVVLDPEVVFVANLMKADAPALIASFQCNFNLVSQEGSQTMKANLKELKVLACPFIRSKEDKAVTTVLRPCSVVLETSMSTDKPLTGFLTVEEVIVKISPVILNTVMTIMAAMSPKPKEDQGEEKAVNISNLWSVMNIHQCNYWFLGVDSAHEMTENFREQPSRNAGESFRVDVKVVQVTLESGMGHRTMPLLLAESSLCGTAKNWSSYLNISADMTLEVNYFNESHAVWEPLIERVENGTRRWNLKLEVKNNPLQDRSPIPGDDFMVISEPQTAISICSKDTMNITMSKCSLNVFSNLAQAFSEGTASTFDHSLKEKAHFTIRNALGIPLLVQHGANLRVVGSPSVGKLHEVGVGKSVDLEHSVFEPLGRGKLSALQRQESCLFNLSLVPTGYSEVANIPVDRPGRRLYNVRSPNQQEAVSVLVQIDATEGNKVITVRSPLQIKNHFSVPFAILKYCPTFQGLTHIGVADPEKELHVALDSYRCQLFLIPTGPLEGQYRESSTCISWKEQVHCSSEVQSVLQCPASESPLLPLVVNTLAVPDDLSFISCQGGDDWDPAYIIHLHPSVTLRNLLPYSIRFLLEGSAETYELHEGSAADVLNARIGGEIMELVLMRYQGRNWNSHVKIHPAMAEFFPVCFSCDSAEKLTVDVSVHVSRVGGRLVLSVFSPYWIINKTSRVLQYRAEDVHVKHPADFRDVILFSFKKKNLFSKNKLQLCVSTSSWSEGFSLDTVGSYGCVKCPASNMDYLVGVSIQMSSFNLSRIVTMSPFYTLVNRSSYELEVGEVPSDPTTVNERWHYVGSEECLPLWPESSTGKLCVRVVGSESSSKSFFFTKQDSGTLLSMDTYGGVIVDVNISDHSTVVSFTDYYEGAAPALLVNHTSWVTVSFWQSGSSGVRELKPGEARRFAWDNPAGVRRLSWSYREQKGELDLVKDESGQFTYDDVTQIHWVSFLDGRQRVLLFTEDVALVTKARQAEDMEQFQQEVTISLQTLGLSLVNNDSRQEVAYVGITSSGVVWEMKPKNRWKPFNQKNINLLEKAYETYLSRKSQPGWVKLETNIEVNFSKVPMAMRQPFACMIRRNFLSGIQVELKQSRHQRSLRAQLHWLQVDNQLTGAVFPIMFHPVPPPKSIALDSEPKPFIDISIITRFNEHSQVMQFKYFMALVQEMAVKIDQGFLGAIISLFTTATDPRAEKQKTKLIERDLESLRAELMEASMTDTSGLSFFEHFHISPIKLHLSLSLGPSGDDSGQQDALPIQSLNLLLKSIGATLTDVDDLIFKLAFFEVRYEFYRREKLMWAVIRHYTEQFLKQMYVLVLGLDVLGNPFGLIRGLSEGVEAFFYEPFQGAVQGPEEFAEGFVIGVRSLLGHTVGGAAGMVSRITGSVGKGLAAITMDKEYQQKRREEMNRPPKDFGGSLAKGGKGLLKGVVGGVTGIVTKPVEGAMKEGAAGFFKGIGKGLVGVVARPTGGIVDMASSTLQGIQRVAESTEEVTRLRPVRLIREDGIVRPFDLQESQGFDLFQRSEVKLLNGEVFREHFEYPGHRRTNILVTNRRVMCVKEIEFVGHFSKEWECLFENFSRAPCAQGSELRIYCKELGKLKIQKKDGQEPVRVLDLQKAVIAEKVRDAIAEAQVARRQHQMVKQKSQRFVKVSGMQ